jgi:predicted ATP-dependent protease
MWEQLSESERASQLAPYDAVLRSIRPAAASTLESSPRAQAWVADFLALSYQKNAVAIIEGWLRDAPRDAQLCVVGPRGHGRMSTVTARAHRTMAVAPQPPDYCYLPDPEDLTRYVLLTLPGGTAVPFATLANNALGHIHEDWTKLRGERGENGDGGGSANGAHAARTSLASYFAPALAVAPTLARVTLGRVQAALEMALDAPFAPPMVDVDPGAGLRPRDEASPDEASVNEDNSSAHAPVVVCRLTPQSPDRLLLRANGGILIVTADLLVEREQPSALWLALQQALRLGAIYLKGVSAPPIPLSLRVIVLATGAQLDDVYQRVEEFSRFFRYESAFDREILWEREGSAAGAAEAACAAFAAGVARHHDLPPLDAGAVAVLIEESARRVGERNRERLSTDLTWPHDLIVEAGKLAQAMALADGSTGPAAATIGRAQIESVLATRREQQGSSARLAREDILLGRERVPTTGAAVGEINGLSVHSAVPVEGTYAVPFRISATVSPGRERLVDIEREASSADRTHISGALTLAGYLASRYGQRRPVSLVARTRFEQRHGFTIGDSASAALLLAILSALAEVPISNARAMTGAVGQYGELQTIGGVNDKIEGFWEICHQRQAAGETSEVPYGIIIPAPNTLDVMLRREVAESIANERWFFVWPVSGVDEAIPLLTGLTAVEFHARVDRRLQHFHELAMPPISGR